MGHWGLKKAINSEFLEAFMADDVPVVGDTNGDMRFNFPNLLMLHYMRDASICMLSRLVLSWSITLLTLEQTIKRYGSRLMFPSINILPFLVIFLSCNFCRVLFL